MKQIIAIITALTIMLVLAGWAFSVQPTPQCPKWTTAPKTALSATPPATPSLHLTSTLSLAEPLPTVIAQFYFGVPIGNGSPPKLIALDNPNQRAYTLNQTGNAETVFISVIDTQTNQILTRIDVPTTTASSIWSWDLQIDPYRPRLYLLRGDLTIIDTEALTVTQIMTDVATIAPGPEQLYMANQCNLWMADPISMNTLMVYPMPKHTEHGPLVLNATANRLYIGHNGPAMVDVFQADTLTLLNNIPLETEFKGAVVDEAHAQIFVMDDNRLDRLDADGERLDSFQFKSHVYQQPMMAVDQQRLYWNVGNSLYSFDLFDLEDFGKLQIKSLDFRPSASAFDSKTQTLYAIVDGRSYIKGSGYIAKHNLVTGESQRIHSHLSIVDVVTDPLNERLYLIDQQGTLRILALSDFHEISRLEIKSSPPYLRRSTKLSLDSQHHKLYISGNPIQMVDTKALTMTTLPELSGSIVPDLARNWLYVYTPKRVQIIEATSGDELAIMYPYGNNFPSGLMGPHFSYVTFDPINKLLYASGSVCTGGSSCGSSTTTVFDVAELPPKYITNLHSANIVIDPVGETVFFAAKDGIGTYWSERHQLYGRTLSRTLTVPGLTGAIFYNAANERLYINDGIFDRDFNLLAVSDLPGRIVAADPTGQRLFSIDREGNLFVIATSGGELRQPSTSRLNDESELRDEIVTAKGVRFRLYQQALYRSNNNDQSWERLGTGLPNRDIITFTVSPDYHHHQTLFVAIKPFYHDVGGLYWSADEGEHWFPSRTDWPTVWLDEIIFSPTYQQDNVMFATMFVGNERMRTGSKEKGIFRSTDGGKSWQSSGYSFSVYAPTRPIFAPSFATDGLIFIASSHRHEIIRSADRGGSWEAVGGTGERITFSPHFTDDGVIIRDRLWHSADSGQSWQSTAELPDWFAATQIVFATNYGVKNKTIYTVIRRSNHSEFTIRRSVNAGLSWQTLSDARPLGFEEAHTTILPSGELQLTTEDGQSLSLDLEKLTWKDDD